MQEIEITFTLIFCLLLFPLLLVVFKSLKSIHVFLEAKKSLSRCADLDFELFEQVYINTELQCTTLNSLQEHSHNTVEFEARDQYLFSDRAFIMSYISRQQLETINDLSCKLGFDYKALKPLNDRVYEGLFYETTFSVGNVQYYSRIELSSISQFIEYISSNLITSIAISSGVLSVSYIKSKNDIGNQDIFIEDLLKIIELVFMKSDYY